ncbi:MAG: ATP-binding protein [Defluviitaleaceae bacterium]|nr:ATP-binding protein [Defluviitaleaceae bacterium]
MRKTPIFVKMLMPVICVMLMQSGIIGIFLVSGGAVSALNEHAVSLLSTNAAFRGENLEALMVNYWSNLDDISAAAGDFLYIFLDERGLTLDEFLGDRQHEIDWLYHFSENLIDALRTTAATGIFMYFLDGICPSEGGLRQLNGFYLQDHSALPNIHENLRFVAGYYRIARKHSISHEAKWTERLIFEPENYGMWRGFAYPQLAAKSLPGAEAGNLSFWNPAHYLHKDSSVGMGQISYSRPLFFQGRMIAIIGTEIQITAIVDRHLPVRDFEYIGGSGYAIMMGDPAVSSHEIVCASGPFVSGLFSGTREIQKLGPDTHGLYALADMQDIRIANFPLNIYNAASYFSSQQWAVAAISSEFALFSVSRNLISMMLAGSALAVVLGAILAVFAVNRVTRPIGIITNQLLEKGGDAQIVYNPGTTELDLLCDTINNVNKQRISVENQIREERLRYRLALESSADTFIEYDVENDILQVYYFTEANQLPENRIFNDFSEKMYDVLHPDDQIKFLEERNFELRVRASAFTHIRDVEPVDGDYYWVSVKTIIINEKIIGTAREITREKMRQLESLENARRDITSGFLNRSYGLYNVQLLAENAERKNRPFEMKILRIENFSTLEINFGLVFGGIFIAKFSWLLRQFTNNVTRLGNDEFLIFHDCAEGNLDLDKITEGFSKLYTGGEVSISLSIIPFEYKKHFPGLKFGKPERPVTIFMDINDKRNLGNIAMELLERSPNVEISVKALFGLIARLFDLDRIVICNYSSEFHTDQIAYTWNKFYTEESHGIKNIWPETFGRFQANLAPDGTMVYKNKNVLADDFDSFLCLEPGESVSMFCCAILDGAEHSGRMMFMAENREWPEEERDILRTLSKVIATYMDVEKNRSASKAKSAFLSRVSHEIRTPMNAITGITNIAKAAAKENDIPRITDCLDKIDVSANYLLGLINDVLEMSRIESGKVLVVESIPFDMQKLVDDTEAVIRFSIESNGVTFIINRNFKTTYVTGDPGRIKQVLINLLGNSHKFTKPGGTITLSITEHAIGQFEFSVQDTGIGIPYEKQATIFDAFEQAETPFTQRGTGLGLSISRNIIHAFGSDIILDSTPDVGSQFTFTLQLSPSVTAAEPRARASAYDFTGKRGLIADDVDLNIEITRYILESVGFETEVASNGKEVIEKFLASPVDFFDVILMDIQMPEMDGITASTQIRGLTFRPDSRRIPIIALTANAFDEDRKKSAEAGINYHISKPIDNDELLSLLEDVLKTRITTLDSR